MPCGCWFPRGRPGRGSFRWEDPEKELLLLDRDDISEDEECPPSPCEVISPRPRTSFPRFRLPQDSEEPPQVLGDHNLEPEELDVVLGLEELKDVHRLILQRADTVMRTNTYTQTVMRSSVYFLTPYNLNGEAMLPTVIKIKSAESARKERDAMKKATEHFKHFAMIVKDFNEQGSVGVLQLEISGSRCCIPRFVSAVEQTRELGQKFTEALFAADAGKIGPIEKVQSMVNEICVAILKPALQSTVKKQEEKNFMQLMDGPKVKLRLLGDPPNGTKFGPPYFDGQVVLEQFGGLLSDQNQDELANPEVPAAGGDKLLALIHDATGHQQQPSEYFASFYRTMELFLSKLVLKPLLGIVHGDLHFGNIMVDADDRLWIIDCEDIREGHVFTDIAKILAFGLFCFPKDLANDEEEQLMRSLMRLLASVPEQGFREKAFPKPPDDCPPSAAGIWRIAWLMQRQFAHFSTWDSKGTVLSMDKPHVQMLWALFTESIKMVTYKQNASFPKRKRLALFFAASLAARLLHEVAGEPKPAWLGEYAQYWRALDEDVAPQFTTLARERYSYLILAREAWVRDPFTHQKFDVLKDTVQVTLQHPSEQQINGRIRPDAQPTTGYEDVARLLLETQRLLVVGPAGSGKTVLTKQLITYLLNESVAGERLPVRIPLMELWLLTTGESASAPASELLTMYLKVNLEESVAPLVEAARYGPGLILILDGLDEAEDRTWINEFVQSMAKENHLMLITTRPSALEINPRLVDNPLARLWRGGKAFDRVKTAQQQVKEWGFAVCEIKEFGTKQLSALAESRLGSERARDVQDAILQPAYRELVRVPLLATMMMHMMLKERDQVDESGKEALTHCCVIEFAFEQLLRHIDVAKRREPGEFCVLEGAEAVMFELAYKKQSTRSKTIQLTDLTDSSDPVVRQKGQAIWKLGRSGQLALFEVSGHHLQFFHLMIQEYLAASHVFTLLENRERFPTWLYDDDEFALAAHHFFGALCRQRNFSFQGDDLEAATIRTSCLRLLQRAFVVNDRFAIEGLFNLFCVKGLQLDKFHLDLSGRNLTKVDQLGKGLRKLTSLEQLDLNLKWSTHITRITELTRAFQKLTSMTVLKLDLTYCHNIKNVGGLKEIHRMKSLRELELIFNECRRLQRVDELGEGLANLTALMGLRLDFGRCERLQSLEHVGRSIANLTGLTKLVLDVSACPSLDSLDEVGKGMANLSYMQDLRLTANGTRVQMDEVAKGMSHLKRLRYLSLDCKVYSYYFSLRNFCTGRWRCRHFFIFAFAYAMESVQALFIFCIILCQFIVLIILDKF